MDAIEVLNVGGRLLTLLLDHPRADKIVHKHVQHGQDRRSTRAGRAGTMMRKVVAAKSVTLLDGESAVLDSWAADVRDVRRGVLDGVLQIRKLAAPAAAAAQAPQPEKRETPHDMPPPTATVDLVLNGNGGKKAKVPR